MASWICAGAARHDASVLVNQMAPTDQQVAGQRQLLTGLEELNQVAQLPVDCLRNLSESLVALGARHVREVTVMDWEALPAFGDLLPFAKRRLLTAVRRGVL